MFKDITYMHEHITIDLSKEKNNIDCKLDLFEDSKNEFLEIKNLGVSRIVDVSNIGIGRDVNYVMRMEKETGIDIYMSTGYYKDPFLPNYVSESSIDDLANIMINDIEIGIDNSSKKASFIGEIGTGFDIVTENEKKVFIASALVQKKTGVFITTHTSLGKLGHEQLDILKENDADLEHVILGHTDLANDLDYIKSLLDRGVYIAFDTIGKISYLPEETRVKFIKELCDNNWEDKLILSVDITRRSHLKVNGGIGYAYLIKEFIPRLLEAGVEESKVNKLLVENPKKILGL
ncbi:Phosphotriesterase homology protein [Brachyspira suanatina]|uniref:Phosphotriesterase homology protein n=1 Tax=Brachyspira suanatina TaxID=381802 RepID=A0A0G4K6U5_9SPIR|nr:TatD family hydrolase [Brachyspira suanatina]CRF33380.1 Phosphotriesterase homology protein [Brachyspira suanatina]